MRFTITVKDPDACSIAIAEAAKSERARLVRLGLTPDEADAACGVRLDAAHRLAGEYLEYGEYLNVEFDSTAGTATVLKVKP